MSKRPETTWRQERKERYEITCEFYRDYKRCFLRDLEFCEHEGNKNICPIYRVEVGLRK